MGLVPVACAGLLLVTASTALSARVAGASLLALALVGEGYALAAHRQARRRMN